MMKMLAVASLTFAAFTVRLQADGHDHSHSSDEDGHDHDHDEHSCHFGIVTDLSPALPVVEDECAYEIDSDGTERSFIFECIDSSTGEVTEYTGTDCASGNEVNTTTITTSGAFDCSTEDECNVYEVLREGFGSSSTNCDGTAVESISYTFTDGANCVDTLDGKSIMIEFSSDATSYTYIVYNDNSCTSQDYNTTGETGCTESLAGGYQRITIELEDEDSSAFGLLLFTNKLMVVMAAIGIMFIMY